MQKNINLSHFKNKTILITGGSGYLGLSLIRELAKVSCKIIIADKKRPDLNYFKNSKFKTRFELVNICEEKIWKQLLKGVDILFHFAAQTSSQFANEHPVEDLYINVLPVVHLIQTCIRYHYSPDIIFSGTATEVGMTNTYPVDEKVPDTPVTIYDINKLSAENYLRYYSNQLSKRATILRLANVYGPGPASSRGDRGITNLMISRALNGKELTIYGKGNFIRDYVFIEDVISAFLKAAVYIGKTRGKYFLVGSGIGHTIKEMVTLVRDRVKAKTGRESKITHIPFPKGLSEIEFRNFTADIAAFRKATGWRPEISLSNGIDKTIAYFLQEGN